MDSIQKQKCWAGQVKHESYSHLGLTSMVLLIMTVQGLTVNSLVFSANVEVSEKKCPKKQLVVPPS